MLSPNHRIRTSTKDPQTYIPFTFCGPVSYHIMGGLRCEDSLSQCPYNGHYHVDGVPVAYHPDSSGVATTALKQRPSCFEPSYADESHATPARAKCCTKNLHPSLLRHPAMLLPTSHYGDIHAPPSRQDSSDWSSTAATSHIAEDVSLPLFKFCNFSVWKNGELGHGYSGVVHKGMGAVLTENEENVVESGPMALKISKQKVLCTEHESFGAPGREFETLKLLHAHSVPVPRPIRFCMSCDDKGNGRTLIVMEMIDGATLREWINAQTECVKRHAASGRTLHPVISLNSAVDRILIAIGLIEALEKLHPYGVFVDLKPRNIMISKRRFPMTSPYDGTKPPPMTTAASGARQSTNNKHWNHTGSRDSVDFPQKPWDVTLVDIGGIVLRRDIEDDEESSLTQSSNSDSDNDSVSIEKPETFALTHAKKDDLPKANRTLLPEDNSSAFLFKGHHCNKASSVKKPHSTSSNSTFDSVPTVPSDFSPALLASRRSSSLLKRSITDNESGLDLPTILARDPQTEISVDEKCQLQGDSFELPNIGTTRVPSPLQNNKSNVSADRHLSCISNSSRTRVRDLRFTPLLHRHLLETTCSYLSPELSLIVTENDRQKENVGSHFHRCITDRVAYYDAKYVYRKRLASLSRCLAQHLTASSPGQSCALSPLAVNSAFANMDHDETPGPLVMRLVDCMVKAQLSQALQWLTGRSHASKCCSPNAAASQNTKVPLVNPFDIPDKNCRCRKAAVSALDKGNSRDSTECRHASLQSCHDDFSVMDLPMSAKGLKATSLLFQYNTLLQHLYNQKVFKLRKTSIPSHPSARRKSSQDSTQRCWQQRIISGNWTVSLGEKSSVFSLGLILVELFGGCRTGLTALCHLPVITNWFSRTAAFDMVKNDLRQRQEKIQQLKTGMRRRSSQYACCNLHHPAPPEAQGTPSPSKDNHTGVCDELQSESHNCPQHQKLFLSHSNDKLPKRVGLLMTRTNEKKAACLQHDASAYQTHKRRFDSAKNRSQHCFEDASKGICPDYCDHDVPLHQETALKQPVALLHSSHSSNHPSYASCVSQQHGLRDETEDRTAKVADMLQKALLMQFEECYEATECVNLPSLPSVSEASERRIDCEFRMALEWDVKQIPIVLTPTVSQSMFDIDAIRMATMPPAPTTPIGANVQPNALFKKRQCYASPAQSEAGSLSTSHESTSLKTCQQQQQLHFNPFVGNSNYATSMGALPRHSGEESKRKSHQAKRGFQRPGGRMSVNGTTKATTTRGDVSDLLQQTTRGGTTTADMEKAVVYLSFHDIYKQYCYPKEGVLSSSWVVDVPFEGKDRMLRSYRLPVGSLTEQILDRCLRVNPRKRPTYCRLKRMLCGLQLILQSIQHRHVGALRDMQSLPCKSFVRDDGHIEILEETSGRLILKTVTRLVAKHDGSGLLQHVTELQLDLCV